MIGPAVHWHEGMFLRPQHFQAAQRHWSSLVHHGAKWDHHHNWGLRSLDLDLDALANNRAVVRSLEARLRDGTIVSVSETDPLPPLGLQSAFENGNAVTLFLALPVLHLGRPNSGSEAGKSADTRYLAGTLELEDENSGDNAQPVSVRRLNLQLVLSNQAHSGFEVLPLARLVKSARAEAVPELDDSFLPPLLACDAWPQLAIEFLQTLRDRIGKKMELLADQVTARGLTFDSHTQGDVLTFHQLKELNRAYATLGVLAFAQGVHPLTAYSELCRLAGELAIFGPARSLPDLPLYDHDDLASCFSQVRKEIDSYLDVFVEPEYKERAFVGTGLRMQVSLEPAWLESSWQLYLGVRTSLDGEECVKLLTKPGNLDMKIGSSGRVDAIYQQGSAGLRCTRVAHPPRALPQGLVYFQLLREAKDSEWQNVQRSLSLAIRLNEDHITGNIQGQRTLSIRHGGQSVPMQFTLYVMPV